MIIAGLKLKSWVTGNEEIDRMLAGLSDKIAKRTLQRGVKAGARFVAFRVQSRMPKDTGTAANAVITKARKKRSAGSAVAFNVQLETAPVVANSPKSAKHPKGFFYPAVIEFGSVKSHRPAIAPMRRTYDTDGNTARSIMTDAIRADLDRLIRAEAARTARAAKAAAKAAAAQNRPKVTP